MIIIFTIWQIIIQWDPQRMQRKRILGQFDDAVEVAE